MVTLHAGPVLTLYLSTHVTNVPVTRQRGVDISPRGAPSRVGRDATDGAASSCCANLGSQRRLDKNRVLKNELVQKQTRSRGLEEA